MENNQVTNQSLVQSYNQLVTQAEGLGLSKFRSVNRFKTLAEGQRRLELLRSAIQAAGATAGDPATPPAGDPATPPVEPQTPPTSEPAAEPVAEPAQQPASEPAQEESDMAKKAKSKKGAKTAKKAAKATSTRARSANGTSIRAKTAEYNGMIGEAKRAGVKWAKHHTSDFASHEAADKQLKRLRDAIRAGG
jgi:hypothetical protein